MLFRSLKLVIQFKKTNYKLLQIRVASNKTKHVETRNKVTDLAKKVVQISEKGYNVLLDRMYFTDNDGYQHFLVFDPNFCSLVLDSNKKLLTGYRPIN